MALFVKIINHESEKYEKEDEEGQAIPYPEDNNPPFPFSETPRSRIIVNPMEYISEDNSPLNNLNEYFGHDIYTESWREEFEDLDIFSDEINKYFSRYNTKCRRKLKRKIHGE